MTITFFWSICFSAYTQTIQRYNTFSYNVNEGLLQSTISDIAFDKNNFCWLGFPNGIQKFDGKNFTAVPVQAGLPDDKAVLFFRYDNGNLLISHSYGISKYEINNNRFIQIYFYHSPEKTPDQFIGEDEHIVYFYSQTGRITGINCQTLKTVLEINTGFPDYSSNGDYRPKFSSNIINHKTAFIVNATLYLWDLQKGKLLSNSEPIPDISNFFLKLKTESEVLYFSNKVSNAFQVHNFISKKTSNLPIKNKENEPIGRCNIFHWKNKILISFNNRIYETDSTFQILKNELVNFKNQPVTGMLSITNIKEDNFGNLYLQTVTGGIKKIIRDNYPFKYYSTGKPDSNFVISILPDKKNNRILAGTSGNGLLVFDTLQHLIKHIKTMPGRNQPAFPNAIIKTNKGNYLLFLFGEKHVWHLSHDLLQIKSIPILTTLPENKSGINYFGTVLFKNEQEAVIQSQTKLYRTNLSTNITSEHFVTSGYIMSAMLFKDFIITHGNDELFFLDAETFKEIKRVPFKNTGNVRCFAKDEKDNIYLGSNKGIFKIDSTGKILQHLTTETGLPDECIYAMAFDKNGFLWCSTNKGILKINKDNSFRQFKKEDGLQENEFNTNSVAKADDGELFFGGVNGVSSFYPPAISDFEEKINLLVTNIKINNKEIFKDTAVWSIEKLDLSYQQNSLSFDFVAMSSNNPNQYIYQYKMEGVDEQWLQNNDMQTVRYYLQPGTYVFKIYASRFFDKKAKPLKEITIIIHPPYWEAWWFRIGLGFMLLSIMAYIINRYNRGKYLKKLAELEMEQKVQSERERISRDLHDNIGAYANAVLYNTELLENEKEEKLREELMEDLKFASKDIITSLRETIWALKKDNYTAEDCFLRIRNFIQPLTRYYHGIKFSIEGEAPANKILHYSIALNLVRIVQEAVTNAIKHAEALNVRVISNEKDGVWELVVSDDGKGFDDKAPVNQQGNGVNNMKQRAVDAGFDLKIRSWENAGSSVIIRINGG